MKDFLKKELKIDDSTVEVLLLHLRDKLRGISDVDTLILAADILLEQLKQEGTLK